MILDERSQMALYRLMNRGVIAELGHPVKEGKESLIIHGLSSEGEELAIKVHTSRVFSGAEKKRYLLGDWRLRHAKHEIRLRTEAIWAEKEYRNLSRLAKIGIPGPRPVAFEENIVVMTFVGEQGQAAPQLNRAGNIDYGRIAPAVMKSLRALVHRAKLVHGDLSSYNILVWKRDPYLIDLSHAVLTSHPDSARLLNRDVQKVACFFGRQGVRTSAFYELLKSLLEEVGQRADSEPL